MDRMCTFSEPFTRIYFANCTPLPECVVFRPASFRFCPLSRIITPPRFRAAFSGSIHYVGFVNLLRKIATNLSFNLSRNQHLWYFSMRQNSIFGGVRERCSCRTAPLMNQFSRSGRHRLATARMLCSETLHPSPNRSWQDYHPTWRNWYLKMFQISYQGDGKIVTQSLILLRPCFGYTVLSLTKTPPGTYFPRFLGPN